MGFVSSIVVPNRIIDFDFSVFNVFFGLFSSVGTSSLVLFSSVLTFNGRLGLLAEYNRIVYSVFGAKPENVAKGLSFAITAEILANVGKLSEPLTGLSGVAGGRALPLYFPVGSNFDQLTSIESAVTVSCFKSLGIVAPPISKDGVSFGIICIG